MRYMFYAATNFNQDISAWDTTLVTDMTRMFTFAIAFDQNLTSWALNGTPIYTNYALNATAWQVGNRPW